MSVRYFCDVCGVEVYDPRMSLDMTGKILCFEHYREYEDNNKQVYIYQKSWIPNRFPKNYFDIWRLVN